MNELQSLSQIFQNKLFRIPDYQRGYAWQDPQLRDFWEDLINLQADRYHYTGLLSLKLLSKQEEKKLGKDLLAYIQQNCDEKLCSRLINEHSVVRLLYQMRNKIVHELSSLGAENKHGA